ncbi:unnamed protein product [Prorocentrum cordatum]|uniref:Uncharacterized protein n=1 Tax=Prorocentrum cordatum TaxID=2364126 RepID=A0ABN9UD89_9DINO|nr:unnamed protein product [Polarella glacialis]
MARLALARRGEAGSESRCSCCCHSWRLRHRMRRSAAGREARHAGLHASRCGEWVGCGFLPPGQRVSKGSHASNAAARSSEWGGVFARSVVPSVANSCQVEP